MAARGIDFATLSLMDALDLAILIEDEAQERYEDFAAQMDQHRTPDAAKFFRYMVENEAKHGLELAARRAELFSDAPRAVTRAMIFDIEAPDFDAARAFMSPRKAMEAALASEVKAHAFFVAALPALKNAEVRALFEELREEELEHQQLVQAELYNSGQRAACRMTISWMSPRHSSRSLSPGEGPTAPRKPPGPAPGRPRPGQWMPGRRPTEPRGAPGAATTGRH